MAVRKTGEGNEGLVREGHSGEKVPESKPRRQGSVDGAGFQRSVTQEEGVTLENTDGLPSSEAGRREVKTYAPSLEADGRRLRAQT